MEEYEWYWVGYRISWVIIFIGSWIYCIATYGYLLGLGLGWLPSLIVASLASFLWPIAIIGITAFVYLIFKP